MTKVLGLLLIGATMLLAEGIHWETDYRSAVDKSAKVNKPILFVFSSHECKWCRHLEETTFSDPEVIQELNRDFVNVIAYVDAGDYVPRELWVPGTPALWFLDTNGEPMFQVIEGSVAAGDFLQATDIVTKTFEKKRVMKRYGNRKQ